MNEIQNFVNGFTLLGIPAIILIPFLVQGLKNVGLPSKYTFFATLGFSVLVAVLIYTVKTWPQTNEVVQLVVFVLLMALGFNGAYSQAKLFKGDTTKEGTGSE